MLGEEMRKARLKTGLTQEALAVRCGLTREFISQLERNVSSPSVDNFLKICRAMKVPAGSLISRIERTTSGR